MRVEIKEGCLEVTSSETEPFRKKAERFSRDYAVMRAGLVGGHGTTLTFVDKDRTRIVPANGDLAAAKQAMEADYAKAMEANVIYFREIDVEEDLP